MKCCLSLLLFLSLHICSSAQEFNVGRLHQQLLLASNDDYARIMALDSLADYYGFIQADSCLFYAAQLNRLAEKIDNNYGRFLGFRSTFFGFNCQGNYPAALEAALNMRRISDLMINEHAWTVPISYYFVGLVNREMQDYENARIQLLKSIELQKQLGVPLHDLFFAYTQLGLLYNNLGKPDSSFWYVKKGYELGLQTEKFSKYFSMALGALGNIYMSRKQYDTAALFFREGIRNGVHYDNIYLQARNYNNLASLFEKLKMHDSCIYYAGLSLKICREHRFADYYFEASRLLTNSYDAENNADSTLSYMRMMMSARDSVYSQSKIQQYQQLAFNEIQRQQEIKKAIEKNREQVRFYGVLSAALLLLLLFFFFYRNYRQKLKSKIEIEKAYEELKATQAQLIQAEKMASLGELTAGIAHEIQNPLNFVNNFSEVNTELIDEIKTALAAGSPEEAKELLDLIRENEVKIKFHGGRAETIVKGMLQHSRTSTGQRELVDLNGLAGDYFNLSFQGLKAKEKNFNAAIETRLDGSIGKINIVPQDIGRVLLNLFNNAFYAVSEKYKLNIAGYQPKVILKTVQLKDKIEIMVTDNGNGVPKKILEKIFQPFFTTKPTGQGTGLGLSISYDIIKAHQGELNVETEENKFTTFKVSLPRN